jgi:hypothetical protein
LLLEALATLAVASLAIRIAPFRKVAEIAKNAAPARPQAPEAERRIVAQCRWAVASVAARVPWTTVCFQKGLTLHLMLRRRGIASILHYGVGKNPERGLIAHVWITVSGTAVLGGREAPDHACLARFPAFERPHA